MDESKVAEQPELISRSARRRAPTVTFVGESAEGWAYTVYKAFRPALDIALTTRLEKVKLSDGTRATRKTQLWTEGDPPAYAFRVTDCLGSREVVDGTVALNCRLLVVVLAEPDVIEGRRIRPGFVRFRMLEWDVDRYVERFVRQVSQAEFVDILRTGRL